MTATSPSSLAGPPARATVDELDAAIVCISVQLNAANYRFLQLIREFDERLGWAKWGLRNCSEWLAWRCGLTLSAAREKVRTAHALRGLPRMSAAFEEGRLSYSKVRAVTRVADASNEDLLLAYALSATAVQVEERCRQSRGGYRTEDARTDPVPCGGADTSAEGCPGAQLKGSEPAAEVREKAAVYGAGVDSSLPFLAA